MGIGVPTFNAVRVKALSIQSMNNQRQIVSAVSFYATDNDERYPSSVAKMGFTDRWNWASPTKLAADDLPWQSRSVGALLGPYVDDASSMVCPSAPSPHRYLDDAWAQGDQWDNPDTPMTLDKLDGSYCLYWNYVGYLGKEQRNLFIGPQRPSSGGRKISKLLITDYFGFNGYRTPETFVSCERFVSANVLPPTDVQSAYWTTAPDPEKPSPEIPVHAGYTDGHVESFSSLEVEPLRVIKNLNGNIPYEDEEPGPGIFYLPRGKF